MTYVIGYVGGDGYYVARAETTLDAIREFRLVFGYQVAMVHVTTLRNEA